MEKRLEREEKILEIMIKLYCKGMKHAENIHCEDCSELMEYAISRLKSCKFGAKKPVCAKCKIHCYKPQMRKKIRLVMKTTGTKMITKHPIMLFEHLIDMARY